MARSSRVYGLKRGDAVARLLVNSSEEAGAAIARPIRDEQRALIAPYMYRYAVTSCARMVIRHAL